MIVCHSADIRLFPFPSLLLKTSDHWDKLPFKRRASLRSLSRSESLQRMHLRALGTIPHFGRSSLLVASAVSASAFLGLRHLSASPTRTSLAPSMSESTPKTYDVRQRTGGFATAWPYKAQHMERMDESDDGEFYSSPRFVTHIDDRCIHHLAGAFIFESNLPVLPLSGGPFKLTRASDLVIDVASACTRLALAERRAHRVLWLGTATASGGRFKREAPRARRCLVLDLALA